MSGEGPLGALGSFWGRCGQIRIKPMSGGRPELLYFLGYSQKHAHVNMFLRWGCAVRHFRPPKSMFFCNFLGPEILEFLGLHVCKEGSEGDIRGKREAGK